MPRSRRGRLAALALLAVLAGALWWWLARPGAKPHELLTARVDRGPVRSEVSAVGTLQAVLTVQVGSQVTGTIDSLGADFNSVVKRGDVIARIDPKSFEAQLSRAEANLHAARALVRSSQASLGERRASLVADQANVAGARAAAEEAARVLARNQELAQRQVLSVRDLEAAESAATQAGARLQAAEAAVEQGVARVRSAEAQLEQARAQVQQAEAQVDVARVNLEHTVIVSPVDGVVISRNVDVGQTVSASLSAPTLFVIANDLRKMDVIASVDEADIGSVSESTRTSFTVDAFPGASFRGRVRQVRLQPKTAQNVVTYDVLVSVENDDLRLRPGMTANVSMVTAEAEDVLRVPSAALRFWPAEVPRERRREVIAAASPGAAASGAALPGGSGSASGSGSDAVTTAAPGSRGNRGAGGGEASREGAAERPRGGGEGREGRDGRGGPGSRRLADGTSWGVVWLAAKGSALEPRAVRTSVSDGVLTAVVEGSVAEGETVVTGRIEPEANRAATTNPFAQPRIRGGGGGGGGGGRGR